MRPFAVGAFYARGNVAEGFGVHPLSAFNDSNTASWGESGAIDVRIQERTCHITMGYAQIGLSSPINDSIDALHAANT
jgi:hypothetical protein